MIFSYHDRTVAHCTMRWGGSCCRVLSTTVGQGCRRVCHDSSLCTILGFLAPVGAHSGAVCRSNGQLNGAESLFNKALDADPTNPELLIALEST
eukprot:6043836-Amphidinium_carterae.1